MVAMEVPELLLSESRRIDGDGGNHPKVKASFVTAPILGAGQNKNKRCFLLGKCLGVKCDKEQCPSSFPDLFNTSRQAVEANRRGNTFVNKTRSREWELVGEISLSNSY